MKIARVATVALLLFLLSGCKLEDAFISAEGLQRKIDAQQEQIVALQQQISGMQAAMKSAHAQDDKRLSDLEKRVFSMWLNTKYPASVSLSLTDHAYSVIKTNVGNLLFQVLDITPYANGVNIKMEIGNPNSVTFYGLKVNVGWGKSKNDPAYHMKDVDLAGTLLPGYWTVQNIILSPAKTSDIGYLAVSASVNRIGLRGGINGG